VAVDDLKKIVEELVDNAFKFSKSGMPVQVQTDLRDDRFSLHITNCGRRMTSEQIADMGAYVQFERRFYEQQGMGLGLIIVRRLSELYGGRLIIESGSEPQTTVRVTLPVYREDRDPSRQNQATLTSRT
ncbi:MAG: ATP-binding protein, partial [Gemmatimonadaceae bacterium]|nr:ATP-binding protein [Gloeobacterales cyanobacterium ES-bin-141]